MKTNFISFESLGFSKLICDYVDEKEEALDCFNVNPFTLESYLSLAKSRPIHTNRNDLIDALLEFNKEFEPPSETISNIKSLADKRTFTVVTGQQMSFVGGPLFTLYKTITAIKLSNFISKNSEYTVIPVFWLADEDHDFAEIASFSGEGKSGITQVPVSEPKEIHHSAGKLTVSDIENVKNEIEASLPETEFKADLTKLIESCWKPGTSWRTAFGKQLLKIFSGNGLVLCGSDFKPVKELVKPIIKSSILKAEEIYNCLEDQSSEIEKKYHRQAYVGGSQLFKHTKSGRVKIDFEEEIWSINDQKLSLQDLIDSAETSPEKFSPNVFLRPILQEYLLPNLAYIGGPAEVAYHAQMKDLFNIFDVEMPAIVPRISATLVEPAIERLLPEFDFEIVDYRQRIEELEKKYVQQNSDADIHKYINQWIAEISELYDDKIDFIRQIDPSLEGSIKSSATKAENEIQKIRQKIIRSLKQKEEVQLKRIRRIKESLFPENLFQERTLSYIHFLSKYGINLPLKIMNEMADEVLFDNLKNHSIIKISNLID